jgi:ribosomal-protein-alanine acetyltransferase
LSSSKPVAAVPKLRPAVAADLAALVEIEAESFQDLPWPAASFLLYDCTVSEVGGTITGFLVSREIFAGTTAPPEREILNLAVGKRFRRQGIAAALLELELARGGLFFLEVRESNQAAQALYRNHGFTEIGRRRDYYQHPNETAIVMRTK